MIHSNVNELLLWTQQLNYGRNETEFDADSLGWMEKYVSAVNFIYGNDAISVVFDDEEMCYVVTWSSRSKKPPILTSEDLYLDILAAEASEKSSTVYGKIHSGLIKRAKDLAKEYSVKIRVLGTEICFDGTVSSKSVYSRMEYAFNNGDDSISFKSNEISTQTVRVYASQIGGFRGNKFAVSTKNGDIVVFFKGTPKLTEKEECFMDLEKIYTKYGPKISKNAFAEMMNRLEICKDWDEMNKENKSPDWSELPKTSFYNSEEEKTNDETIIDTNDNVREVEGLKQYYIPELEESEATTDKRDDDDF